MRVLTWRRLHKPCRGESNRVTKFLPLSSVSPLDLFLDRPLPRSEVRSKSARIRNRTKVSHHLTSGPRSPVGRVVDRIEAVGYHSALWSSTIRSPRTRAVALYAPGHLYNGEQPIDDKPLSLLYLGALEIGGGPQAGK